ncbi:MAG TPA: NUDIX domain-containing protein [Burkholderiales bacterium]|nr:NUDIX domain-containing protein [Burkholderiales bacterium]
MQQFDLAVLVGGFAPLDIAQRAALQAALVAARRVVALVGSHEAARSLRHPWTSAERGKMLRAAFDEAENARLDLVPVRDRLYNPHQWLRGAQEALAAVQAAGARVVQIALAGRCAPLQPDWSVLRMEPADAPDFWTVRHGVFGDAAEAAALEARLPPSTVAFLRQFRTSPEFEALADELRTIERFKDSWRRAPYPPVLVTTDAVVACAGHLLLVRRAHAPGKGLWALPGGFVDQEETLLEGCLRELREETGLALARGALESVLCGDHVFDAPHRSLRGRTITHAYAFTLSDGELPRVAGGDDAADARWVPLARFHAMEPEMFEDHFHIARFFLG